MTLTLGFSPCPNDTFIFDALINKRIDTRGINFEATLTDVEQLNIMATKEVLHVTKLSYHAYAYLTHAYALCTSGSALGYGVGPLLITKASTNVAQLTQELQQPNSTVRIGIPGKLTTANFLCAIAYPNAQHKTEYVFSAIENALQHNQIDAGLIIHENRFTYAQRGFVKIIDLGEYWQQLVNAPIPLGGIVVSRKLPIEVQQLVSQLIKESVQYAFANPEASKEYIQQHAQEMEESVQQQHINLYVNDFSINLGTQGKLAVNTLLQKAHDLNLTTAYTYPLFVDEY
ncbi:MAG: 1,4-dihydroxy-6-naphthoate synthase [Bacteroidia bacterium]|nr:1,4-dihydroxy-6-naphthoate synthase [Bacteroidia bacterium]